MNRELKVQLIGAVSALVLLMAVGTISYHYLERWDYVQSLYFSVSTMATVGYGDLAPTNDASRLFTVVFMILGVATSLAALSIIGLNLIKKEDKIISKRIKK